MRFLPYSAALAGLLAATLQAPAQTPTYPCEAAILQPEVDVRSGPSKQFMVTSKLKQNDKVLVLRESKEQPGWLEIMPPQGSFSWINAKDVQQAGTPPQAFVNGDPSHPVSIYAGSRIEDRPPDRESMKLTQGTIVALVNRPLKVGNDTWLPIQPHPNEVRYIPADAVRPSTVVSTNVSQPNWNLMPSGYTTNSVLADAEKARFSGDLATARQKYMLVAQTSPDPSQKQYALNILATMPAQPGGTPAQPASRTVMSPANPTTPSGNLTMQSPPAWSAYGRLRDLKMNTDNGQPLYVLEDNQGKTIVYVTTNSGKSLDKGDFFG